ncbi:MAG: hypothetical protein OEW83_21250 [Acidimicrobiia bacterium]|nr:hypothetical protein [Acidimicrobiia bacterium]
MTAAQDLWTSASELLRSQVSEGVWQSTFAQLSPVELTSDRLVLGMPNGIIRDKLDGRYRPLVEDAVTEAAGHDLGVDFQLTVPTLFDESARVDNLRNDGDGQSIDLRDHGSTDGRRHGGNGNGDGTARQPGRSVGERPRPSPPTHCRPASPTDPTTSSNATPSRIS